MDANRMPVRDFSECLQGQEGGEYDRNKAEKQLEQLLCDPDDMQCIV